MATLRLRERLQMKAKLENKLLMIVAISILLTIIIVFFPSSGMRIILGLPFLLFFPGYALVAALFPRRSDLDGIERVALSFGLSIAVVPLAGLILNYTPWGIKLYPILLSLALFILVMSGIAWYRQTKFPQEERLNISLRLRLPSWRDQPRVDKILYLGLAVVILGAVGVLSYVIVVPKAEEEFTEFYIMGLEGKEEGYPTEFVMAGDRVVQVSYGGDRVFEEEFGGVTIGIVNHEGEEASYQVKAQINGKEVRLWQNEQWMDEVGPIVLADEEDQELDIGFAPREICGSSSLVAAALQGEREMVVTQVERFEANDYVQIKVADKGTIEFAQVEEVDADGSIIKLNTALRYDHEEGTAVTEYQKVEFVLYKNGQPYFEGDESLHLWITVSEAPQE